MEPPEPTWVCPYRGSKACSTVYTNPEQLAALEAEQQARAAQKKDHAWRHC